MPDEAAEGESQESSPEGQEEPAAEEQAAEAEESSPTEEPIQQKISSVYGSDWGDVTLNVDGENKVTGNYTYFNLQYGGVVNGSFSGQLDESQLKITGTWSDRNWMGVKISEGTYELPFVLLEDGSIEKPVLGTYTRADKPGVKKDWHLRAK